MPGPSADVSPTLGELAHPGKHECLVLEIAGCRRGMPLITRLDLGEVCKVYC